ncbi:MAG: ABC transporter substrate-binding protein [Bacteroides sp.]|nr:ABC transporter substrate-binding protein [Bacillota bacterium]MCM1393367.1 ABC transporter substrate-binding protein [[Eubacterium] siraeum]MCM1454921.1 ABC transporter substrate-binding protein [Bacteroides sp.]
MKHKKRTVALLAVLMIVCTISVSLVACNKDKHTISDPEERPFAMAISAPDGVFNPFFSTSGNDSTIISMTQIAMLNTDVDGKPVAGDNEPTVTKDYTVVTAPEEVNGVVKNFTTYEFLIKNGIKWPNGSDLTIHDVLFNLYVYLDPVYTGSATIYSTDIVGLQAYRQQDPLADDTANSNDFDSQFVSTANTRIDNVIEFVKFRSTLTDNKDRPSSIAGIDTSKALLDYAYVAKTFYEELLSDWNAINKEDYEDWDFTEKWQIFMYSDGGDNEFLERDDHGNPNSPLYKDDEGNYKLNTEHSNEFLNNNLGPYLAKKGYATKNGNDYVITPQTKEEDQIALDKAIGDYCVELVFQGKFSIDFPMELVKRSESKISWKNDAEKNSVTTAVRGTSPYEFETIAKYWATATTVLDKFTAEAKTAHFKDNGKLVKSISGVTTRKESVAFNGKNLNGVEYDVLTIKINGVDPKALLNFGFTVAPMYYYSTHSWNNGTENKDYIQAALDDPLDKDDPNFQGEFGLEFGDSDFMTEVVNDSAKIGLPVGGGTYMALGGQNATEKTFFNNNIVNYERNPNFYTVFGNDESKNAKIKYMRYKVVESDQIVNSLTTGNIDYGEPSAKQNNQDILKNKGLVTDAIFTNGYGYVGINPRFIPDVNVRRAIIKALDTASILQNYYKGGFAQKLYRPMSKSISWAYPWGNDTDYTSKTREEGGIGISGTSYEYDKTGQEIDRLLDEQYGGEYTKVDGVYERKNSLKGFGKYKLSYKFTIAGSSKDHPAYSLFLNAAQILNAHGFDIKVVTSQTALSDLSAGKLAVWAAAWSSSVDPDMYQVYHKESQASSVKNWGYAQILGGTNPEAWSDEATVIEKLSIAIDNARSYPDTEEGREARAAYYEEALDWVMELACEFPIYQRKDLFAYQSGLLNPSTLPKKLSAFSGLFARIWEINYYTE